MGQEKGKYDKTCGHVRRRGGSRLGLEGSRKDRGANAGGLLSKRNSLRLGCQNATSEFPFWLAANTPVCVVGRIVDIVTFFVVYGCAAITRNQTVDISVARDASKLTRAI